MSFALQVTRSIMCSDYKLIHLSDIDQVTGCIYFYSGVKSLYRRTAQTAHMLRLPPFWGVKLQATVATTILLQLDNSIAFYYSMLHIYKTCEHHSSIFHKLL